MNASVIRVELTFIFVTANILHVLWKQGRESNFISPDSGK